MEIQKLNAARGWTWVKQGYQLIMRNPLLSITLALVGALAMFVVMKVPLFGPLLALMLMPVIIAGYTRVCRALEENEEVELMHIFAGFEKHTARLTALGAFLLLGFLFSSMVMVVLGGDALTTLLEGAKTANDPQMLIEAMWTAGSGVAFSLLVTFALLCVLMLAFQYAPMLVFFSGLTPFAALRASLVGTLRNLGPYVVYSVIMQVVALALSLLPFNIGLIVLLPLGFTSLYVSYRNIFPFPDELAVVQPAAPDAEA
jgi:uncharacterized membrane protein